MKKDPIFQNIGWMYLDVGHSLVARITNPYPNPILPSDKVGILPTFKIVGFYK